MRKISLFEEDVFWKLLESFICISYHENCFEQYFCRKFQVFKNSDFQLFQLIKAVSRPIENEQLLGQNSLPFSNPLISRNLFFKILRSLLDSFRPIKFQLQFTKCNYLLFSRLCLQGNKKERMGQREDEDEEEKVWERGQQEICNRAYSDEVMLILSTQ